TVFYGVLSVNKRTSAIGGFVQNNYGYIFGSFSNMHISNLGGKTSVGGFVYSNNGVMDYCYASGYATTDTDSSFDIFAYNEGDGSAIKSTCYSLFAPFVSGNLSTESETINHFTQITNKGSVSYEADAIEYYFVGDTTNVDVLYGKTDTSGYYACKEKYNAKYPVLYNKFEGLDYVRQSSYVYPHTTTANKSGLVNEYVYYNNNKVDTKFMIVPTATAFIKMKSGASAALKNYVITRHMNFGYMGFNSENNRGSIKNTLEADGSIISELDFINIDGQNHSIMNLQLGKCDEDGLQNGKNLIGVLDSNAKLYDLRFQNLTLYDSTGIIGENYGTITGVIIAGNINYSTYTHTEDDCYFGTLVGKNYGYVGTTKEIEDGAKAITATKAKSLYGCKINADSINGANSTAATYYFGGLVGENLSNGFIKNITINLNNVKINEKLTSGGGCIVQNLYFGGALGLLVGGEVSNCVLETAKVLVVAGNEVVVGGIIAWGQEGEVYNCETKTNCTIQAGSEDDEMQDDVLITPGTQTSYIGGIVGIGPIDDSSGLSIYDCYNGADIYAKAVWNFSGETRQIENKYKGEDKAPVSVYIVKKGRSDANAGGIISNYL
ncbi:MAG: hypothetical protein IK070_03520, partial [Clostridia bacterium]|nr:hypothetical protein [Clostridia bacterium]